MEYRSTASFGKRQEYIVVAELLKRNFNVYMTLVDDQGIDCIVRFDEHCYIDLQIKARSENAKYFNLFSAMKFEPKDNYFFIFYTEKNDTFWIMPSHDVAEYAQQNKDGKHQGKYALRLPKSEKSSNNDKFEKYKNENGFQMLKEFNK